MPAPRDSPPPDLAERWGPSHQWRSPPRQRKRFPVAKVLLLALLAFELLSSRSGGVSPVGWIVRLLLPWTLGFGVLLAAVRVWHAAQPSRTPDTYERVAPVEQRTLGERVRARSAHDLPALASEAGGQHLHLLIGLQDLSQARKRWGENAADGFLSLFQTKVILNGIADPKTLEAISLCLGEYDRQTVSQTLGRSEADVRFTRRREHPSSDSYQTQRQRVLTPGNIASLPDGQALHLHGTSWQLIRTTPWYQTRPWVQIATRQTQFQPSAPCAY